MARISDQDLATILQFVDHLAQGEHGAGGKVETFSDETGIENDQLIEILKEAGKACGWDIDWTD